MESKYYAVCKAVPEALFLRMQFEQTGLKVDSPIIIWEDNKSCISFSKTLVSISALDTLTIDTSLYVTKLMRVKCRLHMCRLKINYLLYSLSLLMLISLFFYKIVLWYVVQHFVLLHQQRFSL